MLTRHIYQHNFQRTFFMTKNLFTSYLRVFFYIKTLLFTIKSLKRKPLNHNQK